MSSTHHDRIIGSSVSTTCGANSGVRSWRYLVCSGGSSSSGIIPRTASASAASMSFGPWYTCNTERLEKSSGSRRAACTSSYLSRVHTSQSAAASVATNALDSSRSRSQVVHGSATRSGSSV